MKRLLWVAAVMFALSFAARAQTDAMPPERNAAPADMHHDKPPVPASRSLGVTFQGKTVTLTVEQLLAMPQVTVRVRNAHRNTEEEYTGPLVSDVLVRAGFVAKGNDALVLHSSVVATGTDKYFVVYSAAEMMPGFATGQVIVAVSKAGGANAEGGVIQLINTADAKPARWVHGLAGLSVVAP